MGKQKETYRCSECGAQSPQWKGQCPSCGAWNTLALVTVQARLPSSRGLAAKDEMQDRTQRLMDVKETGSAPYTSGIAALDRVLGAGLVPGAVLLVGGEPGIGKSTLFLQVAGLVAKTSGKVLYASGEEALPQIKARGERLRALHENLLAIATSSVEAVVDAMERERPVLLILDSVQTMTSMDAEGLPGNVSQVRAVATVIIEACRKLGVTGILVGHVTKDGTLAGPRMLEHMVDTVISLEGNRGQAFRLMRVFKNRFGPNEELLVFRMGTLGLEVVDDPSTFFLDDRNTDLSGTAVVMGMDGRRPFAVEVQALVSHSFLAIPRRVALGFDLPRLNLLLAVLEKRLRLSFAQVDIYAKVGGGMKIQEPGLDLGIVAAILSSYYDMPLPEKSLFFGEVDLNGQVRPVAGQDLRLRQAKRLSFAPIVYPGKRFHDVVDVASMLFGSGAGEEGRQGQPQSQTQSRPSAPSGAETAHGGSQGSFGASRTEPEGLADLAFENAQEDR